MQEVNSKIAQKRLEIFELAGFRMFSSASLQGLRIITYVRVVERREVLDGLWGQVASGSDPNFHGTHTQPIHRLDGGANLFGFGLGVLHELLVGGHRLLLGLRHLLRVLHGVFDFRLAYGGDRGYDGVLVPYFPRAFEGSQAVEVGGPNVARIVHVQGRCELHHSGDRHPLPQEDHGDLTEGICVLLPTLCPPFFGHQLDGLYAVSPVDDTILAVGVTSVGYLDQVVELGVVTDLDLRVLILKDLRGLLFVVLDDPFQTQDTGSGGNYFLHIQDRARSPPLRP